MQTKKKYLLIPAMPTPNGRLHLGHIGGPFLKMDILARSLQRHGHIAKVMSASDIYESYVLLKAHQTGWEEHTVCNHFHDLMERDLEALMIDCTYFNPLDEAYKAKVDQTYRDTMEALSKTKSYYRRKEHVLYSEEADKYIAGTWIQGDCPHCGEGAGSYLCEACGMQFNPEDLDHVKPTLGETDLVEKEVNTYFLKVADQKQLMDHIGAMEIRGEFLDIIERYLAHYEGEVRITNPGDWGVPWGSDRLEGSNFHVIFPYTGLFSLSRVCGDLFAKEMGLGENPFDKKSQVTTVASFGIDSTIPWFVGVLGSATASETFKPFDYLLTNHFYRLEGSKFSTSRLHVIWAGDIVEKTKATSDAVRFYLAKHHPEDRETDFNVSDFINFNNEFLVKELDQGVRQLWDKMLTDEQVLPLPTALFSQLESDVSRQSQLLMPPGQRLNEAVAFTESWIHKSIRTERWQGHPYWLLKSLSLMLFPIMPQIGKSLWNALGTKGIPTMENFGAIDNRNESEMQMRFFEKLEYSDLLPCLPATITENAIKS